MTFISLFIPLEVKGSIGFKYIEKDVIDGLPHLDVLFQFNWDTKKTMGLIEFC